MLLARHSAFRVARIVQLYLQVSTNVSIQRVFMFWFGIMRNNLCELLFVG